MIYHALLCELTQICMFNLIEWEQYLTSDMVFYIVISSFIVKNVLLYMNVIIMYIYYDKMLAKLVLTCISYYVCNHWRLIYSTNIYITLTLIWIKRNLIIMFSLLDMYTNSVADKLLTHLVIWCKHELTCLLRSLCSLCYYACSMLSACFCNRNSYHNSLFIV